MVTIITAFLLAFLVGLVLTPAVRDIAIRAGALDHALSSRKIHGRPVPRLGGVAVVAAFLIPLVGLFFLQTQVGGLFWQNRQLAAALMTGALAMAALGVYDDLKGAGAKLKLAVQVLAALGMWWAGFRVDVIANPFGAPVEMGVLSLPFTVIWIVGVTNALNLIDGLDGLAGGVALAAVGAIFLVAWQSDRLLMALLMAALGGSLLGFLRYNFNPASIFLGDSGSLFLGFVLATASLQTSVKSTTAVAIIVPIVALGLPIGDTLLAMVRRAARGQPIFAADRGHVHHRLLGLGLSHRATVLVLYALCIILAGMAVGLSRADAVQTLAFGGALLGLAVALLTFTGYIGVGKARWILQVRRQNLAMRTAVRATADRLRAARTYGELWVALADGVGALGADSVALALVDEDDPDGSMVFASVGHELREGRLLARFSLRGERPDAGSLELGFSDGRPYVERDTEIAVEALCAHVRLAAGRIAASQVRLAPVGAPGLGPVRARAAEVVVARGKRAMA
jgi:UDP-GlcNAc:undecaprenyl-phosphate GlcNAc-1-phosphate transferase